MCLQGCFILLIDCVSVQIVPQQQATMARPQVALAQPSVVTLRGQPHSRIIVGQLQTGVGWLLLFVFFVFLKKKIT